MTVGESLSEQEWQSLRAAGYKPYRPFEVGRFVVGIATASDRPGNFVYKVNVPPTSPRRLLRQAAFDEVLNDAAGQLGRTGLVRAPFVEFVPGFVWPRACAVFQYFDGGPLGSRRRAHIGSFPDRLRDVAAVLIFLDGLDGGILDREDLWSDGDRVRIDDRRANWCLSAGLLTPTELTGLQEIAEAGERELRLQHGDFVPWHLCALKDGALGLIDSEWGGAGYPRFWDLAYLYHRLVTRLHDPDVGRRLLGEFLYQSGLKQEALAEGLMPILASRAVNGLYECLAPTTAWATERVWANRRGQDKRVLDGHAQFKTAVMKCDLAALLEYTDPGQ